MAAQVVIELIPDVSKVKSSIDELSASGAVSDGSASAYKAGNAELTKRNALLNQTAQAASKVDQAEKKQIATLGQVQKAANAVASSVIKLSGKEFANAMAAQGKSAQQLMNSLAGVNKEVTKQIQAEESLRSQKRKLTEEIGKLIAAGQQESATFKELVARAGEIDDAMKDASDAIARSGSDTRGLDTAITAAQGVAAGFAVAEGAAALFGDESEEVQKVLLKVNAAMAVLNGLQQIQNILRSEYIKTLIQTVTVQKLQNAQTSIDTALQSRSIVVRTGAAVAQRVLNAAMSANPIGLVVVALTAAVAAMKAFTDWAGRAAAAQIALNGAMDATGIDAEFEAYDRLGKKRIADLQAAGAAQSKIDQAEMGILRAKGIAVAREIENVRAVLKANQEASEERQNLVKREQALVKQLEDINTDGYVKQRDLQKSIREEQKASAEEAKKRAQEIADAQKEAAERARKAAVMAAEDRVAGMELALIYAEEGSKLELEARIDMIEEAAKRDLLNAELTENQKRVIRAKSEKEIADLRNKYRQDEINQRIKDEEELLNLLNQINSNRAGREANDVTKSEAQRFKAAQAAREEELRQIQDQQARIEALYQSGNITYHQYEMEKTALLDKEEQKRFEISQANAERTKDLNRRIAQEVISIVGQSAQAIFDVGAAQRDAELQHALSNIDKEREYALKAKNLTEQQKSDIQKKYDRETARLKNEAARKERRAQVAQAIVNGALAVVNALATVQPFYAAIVAAAGAAVSTGIQVAKINSTPLPAYEKGGKNIPKGYALVGEKGPEIVKFNGGEDVYDARKSDRIMREWNAADHSAAMSGHRSANGIDYEELGRAVAKHMPNLQSMHLNLDQEGFKAYIQSENYKRTIRNARYSTR